MFAISGRNLPRARSYEDALKVYDNAFIHERFGNWRGLVNKQDTTKCVKLSSDGRVAFRFHNTAVVTWGKGTLDIRPYDSTSTVIFAGAFLPHGIRLALRKKSMYVVHDSNWYTANLSEVIFDLRDEQWHVRPETVYTPDEYVLDKSLAAWVRKILRPFREYRDSLLRLRQGRHVASFTNADHLCQTLKLAFQRQEINDTLRKLLLDNSVAYDDDLLLRNAYCVGGAVKKVPRPLGARPMENKFTGVHGLRYI